ncbi:CDP-alcohol phosphatidyltransferase family protein [Arcticibacter sp. MXS-1]|uniref:CDP-alcohol phosphatidyltransferase family protein n=1 Tax=Arcticibacter sp. MXS-1 TaxID=3341726 RepID=UPI0035A8EC20
MLKKIPLFLILFRLLAGFLIIILAFLQPLHFRAILLVLLATGLLSDILDGIIARSLGVSGEMLRRLDSSADQVFWLCRLGACYICCPSFFQTTGCP